MESCPPDFSTQCLDTVCTCEPSIPPGESRDQHFLLCLHIYIVVWFICLDIAQSTSPFNVKTPCVRVEKKTFIRALKLESLVYRTFVSIHTSWTVNMKNMHSDNKHINTISSTMNPSTRVVLYVCVFYLNSSISTDAPVASVVCFVLILKTKENNYKNNNNFNFRR